MALIEILTDQKSENELKNVLDKEIVKDNEIMYIKEKNIENIKNIKLNTIVINKKIEDKTIMKKIMGNSKFVILNLDYNDEIKVDKELEKIITYGFNSKSDITVSSIKDDESFLCLQRNIKSIFGKSVDMQEIRANVDCKIDIYNIMIIIALTILYAQ